MGTEYVTIYSRLADLPKEHQIVLITINSLASLASLVIILTLCHGIIRKKLLQTMSFRFILALFISDICITFFEQPLFSIGYAYTFIKANQAYGLQIATQFSSFTFCQFSGGMIFIIAFDRYLHMRYLNRYATVMTYKRANILIAINFTLCLVCGLLFTVSSLYGFLFYVNITVIFADLAIMLTSFLIYIKAFFSLKSRIAESSISKLESDNSKRNIQRADLTYAKGVALIMFSLSVLYMPYFIIGIKHALNQRLEKDDRSTSQSLAITFFWSMQLVLLAPLTNALLLIRFNKKLRSYFLVRMNRTTDEGTTRTPAESQRA